MTARLSARVDEVRIWSAALDGQLIGERMYERIDSGYPGLVGYFPMESISRNEQGTVTTRFSTKNFGEKGSQLKMVAATDSTTNAPALKPGSSADDLDNEVVIRISAGGKEHEVERLRFASDALYGTLENPYVFELKDATGIDTAVAGDGDDTDWWTLQGFRIGRRPSQPGVYVHNGRKVTVRGKVYSTEGGTDAGKKAAMAKKK